MRADQIDLSKLPSWNLANKDSLPTYEQALYAASAIRYLHTTNNLEARNVCVPNYGRDIAKSIEPAFVFLALDRPAEEKRAVASRLLALGLDVYGRIQEGGRFIGAGGGQAWMEAPLAFAAAILNDAAITETLRSQLTGFARQVFRVSEFDVYKNIPTPDNSGRPHHPFDRHHIGMSEWGEQHTENGSRDASQWGASYRFVAASMLPSMFVVRSMTNTTTYMPTTEVSEYLDRFWLNERREPAGSTNGITEAGHALLSEKWSPMHGVGIPTVAEVETEAFPNQDGTHHLYVRFTTLIREPESGTPRTHSTDWTVTVNGATQTIVSLDHSGIGVRLTISRHIDPSDQLRVSYSRGDDRILSYDNQPLASFTNYDVSNTVPEPINSLLQEPLFLQYANRQFSARGTQALQYIKDPRGFGDYYFRASALTPGTYRFELRFVEASLRSDGTSPRLRFDGHGLTVMRNIAPASMDNPRTVAFNVNITGTSFAMRMRDWDGGTAFSMDQAILWPV